MSLLIDLRDLASASNKRAKWRNIINENYFDLGIKFKQKQQPSGKILMSRTGISSVSLVTSVPQHHERSLPTVGSNLGQIFIVSVLQGRVVFQQNGRRRTLLPGQMAVYDIDTPYEADFLDDYQIAVIQAPSKVFDSTLGLPSDYTNIVMEEAQGSLVASSYFQRMTNSLDFLSHDAGILMAGVGLEMTANMLSVTLDRRPGR